MPTITLRNNLLKNFLELRVTFQFFLKDVSTLSVETRYIIGPMREGFGITDGEGARNHLETESEITLFGKYVCSSEAYSSAKV